MFVRQYYGHRTKLNLIGREGDLEKLNRDALKIARKVADDTGTLMAGNICNTTEYAATQEAKEIVESIFKVGMLRPIKPIRKLIIYNKKLIIDHFTTGAGAVCSRRGS